MKVLVTGAEGMLGSDVAYVGRRAGHEVVALGHDDLDVTDPQRVERVIGRERPGAVINCAAWAGVDQAEVDEKGASLVNGEAAGFIADAAASAGAKVLYVSTDYVFDGSKPGAYTESDEPSPLQAYGRSKLAGERATALVTKRSFIVRTSTLFGPSRDNFVETMLRAGEGGGPVVVVHDQVRCPTYTGHLAAGLVRLIDSDAFGVHHMASAGSCSRYDFAMEIFRQSEVVTRVMATTTEMMGEAVPRPATVVLESGRETPIQLPDWKRGIADYLARRDQPEPEEAPKRHPGGSARRQPVLELRPKPDPEEAEEGAEGTDEAEGGPAEADPEQPHEGEMEAEQES